MKRFLLTISILVCFVSFADARQILPEKITKNIGTPDYIVWNNKEMIFVEVKRKNETLKPEQIEWGEFLIKSHIPFKVLRVLPK